MTVTLGFKLTQKQLTEIAQGTDKTLPRNIAINMLPTSTVRTSVSILNKLLIDEAENAQVRRLAAVNLWKSNTATAHRYLLKAAQTISNQEVQGALVKALGRVGDQSALATVTAIGKKARGFLKEQADFAAALISYRHGLPGNDLPIPTKHIPLPASDKVRLKFTAPPKAEVELFTKSLANEPYGITFSPDLMQYFDCPRGGWMMALNQQLFADNGLATLTTKKALLGIMAAKNSEDGRYSTSYVVLCSPATAKGKVNILIHRITGTPAWAGSTVSIDAKQAKFTLQTVESLGVAPMEMTGVLSASGKFTITEAYSASRVTEKKRPQPHI